MFWGEQKEGIIKRDRNIRESMQKRGKTRYQPLKHKQVTNFRLIYFFLIINNALHCKVFYTNIKFEKINFSLDI